jgi:hypothetical protein
MTALTEPSAAKLREAWLLNNHQYLKRAMESVHGALVRHIHHTQQRTVIPEFENGDADSPLGVAENPPGMSPSALEVVSAAYSLTSFERDVLVLCAGAELDAEFQATCGAAQGLRGRAAPTWSLALAALPNSHWSALAPQAPLRRGCLIETLPSDSLTASRLCIPERVLHYLTGLPGRVSQEQRLRGVIEPAAGPTLLAPVQLQLAQRMARCVAAEARHAVKILLCGAEPTDRRTIAMAMCAQLGVELYCLSGHALPNSVAERELICRLWEREVLLERAALLVQLDDGDSSPGESLKAVSAMIESLPGLVLISCRQGLRSPPGHLLRFDVPRLTVSQQQELWHSSLGDAAGALSGHIEKLLTHFNVGPSTIDSVASSLRAYAQDDGMSDAVPAVEQALWESCRVHARPRMDELAQRIETPASWDDLVLPRHALRILRAIVDHKQHEATVHHKWGFARRGWRGLGLSVLFAGASGTGKTLAAEVLANELKLDLYRIDLSQIISKYIGETEKNLRRIFEAAEQGGAILLFDEADALFGKRSEVKDSHDRYANIEVSYLLQRMETYQGISILTTNLRASLDPAFLRRLRFIVSFPLPDVLQRREIWRRVIPAGTPTEQIDLQRLARLNISGGHIQNIALTAAFSAAATGEPLRTSHLMEAAQLEYAKLEKPMTDAEFGGL